jgi:hypothetical protein
MTTRRDALRLASVVPAAALLAACTDGGSPGSRGQRPTGPADLLTVRTSTGLCLIDARSGITVLDPQPGVFAIDGSAIASAAGTGAGTQVRVSPQDHRAGYQTAVAGAVDARAVSTGGYLVALATGQPAADGAGAATYRPVGRSETTIVVVGAEGERHRLTLPGCVEPEAFSISGDRLFVLDYLPPQAPEQYRVRQVDLLAGEYTALVTRNTKTLIPPGAEEVMRGEGRQAVYASTRHLLFTLYTHQPDHEHTRDLLGDGARPGQPHVHAFVHTLDINGAFAYCIDLPAPFGEGPPGEHAIALSTRAGEHPFVVDTTSGTVARLDGEQLTVASVGSFVPGRVSGGEVSAVLTPDGAWLFVGAGPEVVVIRTDTLATAARWTMPGPINGLGASLDGERLWIGQPERALALDVRSGREVAALTVAGLTGIADVHVAQ